MQKSAPVADFFLIKAKIHRSFYIVNFLISISKTLNKITPSFRSAPVFLPPLYKS